MNRPQYTAMRLPVLLNKQISEPAARYIIDLELTDQPQVYPAVASSLIEMARMPSWAGKRIKLATTGRELVYTGSCWVLS